MKNICLAILSLFVFDYGHATGRKEITSPDGKIKVTVTGNRKVKSVDIDPSILLAENADEIAENLEAVLNRALEKAERISEDEMKSAGRDLLPGFPGM